MSTPSEPDVSPVLLTSRIIHIALASGVMLLLGIAAAIVRAGRLFGPSPWSISIFTAVGLMFAVMAIAAHLVVPPLIVAGGRRGLAKGVSPRRAQPTPPNWPAGEAGDLLVLYQTQAIIAAALLEGAAFFNAIIFMIEGSAIALLVAVVLVGLILVRFPTRAGLEGWLERQQELLREERNLV